MRLTKVQAELAFGTAIMVFAGAVSSATAWFFKRLSDMDAHIERLDRAIKALNVGTTDEKYKELIKELLAEQQTSQAVRSRVAAKAPPVHTFGKQYPADSGTSASAPAVPKP